jgi:primary-amine oxidase
VKPEQLFADGWAIGYDDRFPKSKRIQQALLFARFSEHDNLYAHPMDFIPVIDSNEHKVIHIDYPPTYRKNPSSGATELSAPSTKPPALAKEWDVVDRPRIPPPREAFDFLPDLQAQKPDFKLREDVKPLHIVQPEVRA